ncbi:zinc ABC transporter substrate-binding protein [Marinobacter sp.]|uniref:zinc ABC transporter substrate-binding protein n=1 Tax=Marinobacter sp. TaxID=50741 RepID=UPI0019D9D82D|nr:zinc ABC transporter substrate-binding protein [Marinobacter sp.]MBE0484647.1 zinc ABC transporter substrate-binding protein [Marinobacter sp.]
MQFKTVALALGFSAFIATAPAFAANVVASIKPVELLVKAVAGDSVNVSTLVPPGSSPHSYNMRPSQRRALEQADLIFWIGPEMETFLHRLLTGSEFVDRTVAFTDVSETLNKGDHDNKQDQSHGHHHGHHHDHGDGDDPHIWVDPELARQMARNIHARLLTLNDLDKAELDANLARFEAKLTEAESNIRSRLAQASDIGLFAYHSAFEPFAEHYGLTLEGVLTLNPELSPGARHIAEVQQKLQQANQPCLLTEPQFNRQWWRSITEGLDVTFSSWDPLATNIESNADGYISFQNSIADAVINCLPQ